MEVVVCGDDQGYQVKTCGRCRKEHPVERFSRNRSTKDGLSSWCRSCVSGYGKKWHASNREKANATSAAWYAANRARVSAESKAKYAANPEHYKDKAKRYATENSDKVRARAKAWRDANKEHRAMADRAYRAMCPERMAYNRNAWRAANPEKQRVLSAVEKNRRRARMGTAPGSGVSPSQWREVVSDFNGHCAYCNVWLDVPVMEHMDPISRGGYHDVSNIVPACRSCNGRKHVLTALEFLTGFRLDRKVG